MWFKALLFASFVAAINCGLDNQVEILQYDGMSEERVTQLHNQLKFYMASNYPDDELLQQMWQYVDFHGHGMYDFLVSMVRCTNDCFGGDKPDEYILFGIDRGQARLLITGRARC